MIVRGCNFILLFAFLVWFVMIGVDYFLTMNQMKPPFFANDTSDTVIENEQKQIHAYEGVGYSVELTYLPSLELNEQKLSKIDFYIFQKPVSHMVID